MLYLIINYYYFVHKFIGLFELCTYEQWNILPPFCPPSFFFPFRAYAQPIPPKHISKTLLLLSMLLRCSKSTSHQGTFITKSDHIYCFAKTWCLILSCSSIFFQICCFIPLNRNTSSFSRGIPVLSNCSSISWPIRLFRSSLLEILNLKWLN